MLFKALFDIVVGVIGFLVGLLSTATGGFSPIDFSGIADFIDAHIPAFISNFAAWLDLYVPLHEALSIVLTLASLYAGFLVYRLVVRALVRLHLLGGD